MEKSLEELDSLEAHVVVTEILQTYTGSLAGPFEL